MKTNRLFAMFAMFLMLMSSPAFSISVSNINVDANPTDVTIKWDTDLQSNAKVQIGEDASLSDFQQEDPSFRYNHSLFVHHGF